ncbi:MAG: family 20 glycosylhydrolase, partial [Flavisolibacter sp.]
MKRFAYTFLFAIIYSFSFAQVNNASVSLIPIPVSLQEGKGSFVLKNTTSIELSVNDPDARRVAGYLSKKLSMATGFSIPVKTTAPHDNIISLGITNNRSLGKEGYTLQVTTDHVKLEANDAAGLFYGMQSLILLLPKEIESKSVISNIRWTIPSVSITDYPAFGWRGLMLDVSRHFFTKQDVEKFIDEMVKYKFNLLHLHLTDDQGWRIEIKSLPNLTKVGAWRPKREGAWSNTKAPDPSEPKTYGGFYTHEDIKELVQY